MNTRAKRGDMKKLKNIFDGKKEFEITEYEYTNITGGTFSKNISYLKNRSALARLARENNYYIEVIPAKIEPAKVCFKPQKH